MVGNRITDISCIAKLPRLCTLDASKNQIENIDFLGKQDDSLQFLKILKLSNNLITKLPHLNPKCLDSVHLSDNKISDCSQFTGHKTITLLELRRNELISCNGLHKMPKLEYLFLTDNKIESVSLLKDLPGLKTLMLRNNAIASLDSFPDLPELTYLNLRETKLENLAEISNLTGLSKLSELIVAGTPLEENVGAGIKKEILILLENLKLKRINKEEVNEDDVQGKLSV